MKIPFQNCTFIKHNECSWKKFWSEPCKKVTNKTIAAIHFHKKTGEGKPRYSSGLCRQKTHMVNEDRTGQAWTSQKYEKDPVNDLWINSTGIVQLTCYRKVCKGCYQPTWNLLRAEYTQPSQPLSAHGPQEPSPLLPEVNPDRNTSAIMTK